MSACRWGGGDNGSTPEVRRETPAKRARAWRGSARSRRRGSDTRPPYRLTVWTPLLTQAEEVKMQEPWTMEPQHPLGTTFGRLTYGRMVKSEVVDNGAGPRS